MKYLLLVMFIALCIMRLQFSCFRIYLPCVILFTFLQKSFTQNRIIVLIISVIVSCACWHMKLNLTYVFMYILHAFLIFMYKFFLFIIYCAMLYACWMHVKKYVSNFSSLKMCILHNEHFIFLVTVCDDCFVTLSFITLLVFKFQILLIFLWISKFSSTFSVVFENTLFLTLSNSIRDIVFVSSQLKLRTWEVFTCLMSNDLNDSANCLEFRLLNLPLCWRIYPKKFSRQSSLNFFVSNFLIFCSNNLFLMSIIYCSVSIKFFNESGTLFSVVPSFWKYIFFNRKTAFIQNGRCKLFNVTAFFYSLLSAAPFSTELNESNNLSKKYRTVDVP